MTDEDGDHGAKKSGTRHAKPRCVMVLVLDRRGLAAPLYRAAERIGAMPMVAPQGATLAYLGALASRAGVIAVGETDDAGEAIWQSMAPEKPVVFDADGLRLEVERRQQ